MRRNAAPHILLTLLVPAVDAVIRSLWGIRPFQGGSLMRISFNRYRGHAFTLSDGTPISKGQRLAEIHLNNNALRKVSTSGLDLAAPLRHDLRALARSLGSLHPGQAVVAVHGITIHHAGARRLGFSVRQVRRGPYRWLVNHFLKAILATYHPSGKRRFEKGRGALQAAEIWMSYQELLRRYDAPA